MNLRYLSLPRALASVDPTCKSCEDGLETALAAKDPGIWVITDGPGWTAPGHAYRFREDALAVWNKIGGLKASGGLDPLAEYLPDSPCHPDRTEDWEE